MAEGVTLDFLAGRVKELQRQIHHLHDGVAHVRHRFDGLEARFGAMEQRFTALEGCFSALERRVDRGFADLHNRFAGQQEQIAVIREQQDASFNALLRSIAEVKSVIETRRDR